MSAVGCCHFLLHKELLFEVCDGRTFLHQRVCLDFQFGLRGGDVSRRVKMKK
jgi:hypothetical protein